MAAPHYVAKKVGDQYVLQRKDVAGDCQDVLWASLGGVLALCGLMRRGLLGWAAAFGGAAMIWHASTGKNPLAAMLCKPAGTADSGPSHQNDARPTEQTPVDPVEEADMESFPASDPPARSGVAAIGGKDPARDVVK